MIDRLDSRRLSAAPLTDGDLPDLIALHRDPAVMATLGGRLWEEADNRAFLDRMLGHWDRYGYGVWAVRLREDGRFAGRAGLNHKLIDGVEEVELLYGYHADLWGRGLASEMATAIVDAAFERLHLPSLVALTLPTNRASQRVMEKAGFRYERDVIHAALPHQLHRLRPTAPG